MMEMVIKYFKKVCSIPRASGDEKAISDFVVDFAKERGLEVTCDSFYNVIIKKPATVSGSREPVIIQGHLDMVYVKEHDSDHVYEKGIDVQEDETYFYARGTSLGADNGIAIAYCLALLDSKHIPHPDLEVVFTVKEEVGLVGADVIDISSLKGTRLINLDSEEEGVFCTSCAGGLRCRMTWDLEPERLAEDRVPLTVTVGALAGGHSGINIGMGLGNAIVLLGRLLYNLKDMNVHINQLNVPGKANAIPNAGSVCLYVKQADIEMVKQIIKKTENTFQAELKYTDKVSLAIKEGQAADTFLVYSAKCQKQITDSLMLLPDGISGYSFVIKGLVETSLNLGSLTVEEGRVTLLMSMRSSIESRKYMIRDKIQIIAEDNCDACVFENDYPSWEYRKDSELRDSATKLYERMFHKKAELAAIHAGLECGYWDSKKPGIDMISMGPDLFDVHSAKERASRESVSHMWEFLVELLKDL